MSKLSARERAAIADIEAIYARLPTIPCRGDCAEACGPILLSPLEARRLQAATHTKPRTIPLTLDGRYTERCIYLTPANRCRVHAMRPLICRAWGMVKRLSCMRGCVPSEWLSDGEFLRAAQAIEAIGGGSLLRTEPDGLTVLPVQARFGALSLHAPRYPVAEIAAEAERVRGLRALLGGRVTNIIREE